MKHLRTVLANFEPRTPWFGVGRSLIAFAQLTVLVFTTPASLLQPLLGTGPGPACNGVRSITLYCIGGSEIPQELRRWVMVAMLVIVISGFLPRYTVWLHAWVSISLGWSISLPDGGEQIARIIVVLLVVIGLADNRTWHWTRPTKPRPRLLSSLALAALVGIRVQVAIVYFHAGISKFWTDDWANGSAEYYFIRDPLFGASGLPYVILHDLTAIPIFVALMTWGGILLELLIAVLILGPRRWRERALGLDILLHGFIIATMGLWSFGLIMIGTAIVASAPHTLDPSPTPVTVRRLLGYVGVQIPRRAKQASAAPRKPGIATPEPALSQGGS
ncbi:sporulation-delaying protein SdpB family protein [Microbacterium azadirachtae]|uniref:Sporulation-delaying protein SdpB n=1 Tax=Microbacterium azadirachtae TaxID=582680 RepID=A0A0F0LS32_9MICO|nr:sporulation-delaying protein SdpB family protein [Microbacterium azadirachtae]KJL34306.1 Sporulation-delaying protein SdpB [Microbacterium azadirachtae]